MFRSPVRQRGKELWENMGEQHVLADVEAGESLRFVPKPSPHARMQPTITTPVASIETDGDNAYLVMTGGGGELRGSIYRLVTIERKRETGAPSLASYANPMNLAHYIGEKVQKLLRD